MGLAALAAIEGFIYYFSFVEEDGFLGLRFVLLILEDEVIIGNRFPGYRISEERERLEEYFGKKSHRIWEKVSK